MCNQSDEILARLSALGLPFELFRHPPVPTANARLEMKLDFNACVCKNLLVTTRNENRFLLIMLPLHKNADLKRLRCAIGSTRLGFASDRALYGLLRQEAGSVGVLGVIFDREKRVEVVFDTSLRGQTRVATHPGDNTQTVVTAFEHIEKYVRDAGNRIHFFDF